MSSANAIASTSTSTGPVRATRLLTAAHPSTAVRYKKFDMYGKKAKKYRIVSAMESTNRALRRQELAKEIAEYARENAGTSADLDAELETAGIESLRPAHESDPFDAAAGPE